MTFLPIVERELRVTARRPSTYYLRSVIGLIAAMVGGMSVLMLLLPGSFGVRSGTIVFTALSYYLFGLCLLGGFFRTADCLSEERREGTLGLLFLTDLRGYDVVLGKLLGVSWNVFYGLLAVFPILGLSLVIGGVEGAEFWRVCLALLNALWFSTTATLWLSSRTDSGSRAMFLSAMVLLGMVVVLPALSAAFRQYPWTIHLSAVSPRTPFEDAFAPNFLRNAAEFWRSLVLSHLTGWIFLALASRAVTKYVEGAALAHRATGWKKFFTDDLLFGRGKRRPGLLEINAISWFLEDSPRLRWVIRGVSILGCAIMFACIGSGGGGEGLLTACARPFYFALKLLFAFQSCRFFAEARRNGTLDLLFTTPIAGQTLMDGQWQTLRRLFLWPVVALMSTEVLCLILRLVGHLAQIPRGYLLSFEIFAVPWQLLTVTADFFAIGWVGMWLGLTAKKPQSAAGMTVLWVLILPMLAFCVPSCLVDQVFISKYRPKLNRDFRAIRAEMEAKSLNAMPR